MKLVSDFPHSEVELVADARVLHPRDHVRVGNDEVRGGDPPRAFDAEAAGRAEDAYDARGGRFHLRVVGDRWIRGAHVGRGPLDRRGLDLDARAEPGGVGGAVDAVRAADIIVGRSLNYTPYIVAGLVFVALSAALVALWLPSSGSGVLTQPLLLGADREPPHGGEEQGEDDDGSHKTIGHGSGSVPDLTDPRPDGLEGAGLDGMPQRVRQDAELRGDLEAAAIRMPAWRGRLSEAQVDDLIAYLRALAAAKGNLSVKAAPPSGQLDTAARPPWAAARLQSPSRSAT